MAKITLLAPRKVLLGLLAWAFAFAGLRGQMTMAEIDRTLDAAEKQMRFLLSRTDSVILYPRTAEKDGTLVAVPASDWTSGFVPGTLWYLASARPNSEWRAQAELWSRALTPLRHDKTTHDLGFMLYSSLGIGYRLTGDQEYRAILLDGAQSLASRFNPAVGCIKSWDFNAAQWRFPVIIDNMMNLEYLFWASRETGDPTYARIARRHALTTLENHFREDASSVHLVDYHPETGLVRGKQTVQGYSDTSAWARGQAWGLYGYTTMYRDTKDRRFLDQAVKIANYWLKRAPAGRRVPSWDFDAPPETVKTLDASAAAVAASALFELAKFVDAEKSKYLEAAHDTVRVLASPEFFAAPGENGGFLIKHCTGHLPEKREIDAPLNYADYYFIEALLRSREYLANK